MISFSSWNLFGALSTVGKNQAVNIVLNLFFGTIINAAYGISVQVQAAVTQFVNSFQAALNPQIIQLYATDNKPRSLSLIFTGSKFSFFLMLFIAVPVFLNTETVLKIWLGNIIPDYTVVFLKYSLVILVIDCISGPIMTGVLAAGIIKRYHIWIGGLNLIIPIVIYVFLFLGFSPTLAFKILLLFSIISFIFRLSFLKQFFDFSYLSFFRNVLLPILYISFFVCIIVFFSNYIINVRSVWEFVLWCLMFFILYGVSLYFIGIDRNIRKLINLKVKSFLRIR